MADLNFSTVSVRKNNAALSDLIAVGSTLVCGPVFRAIWGNHCAARDKQVHHRQVDDELFSYFLAI